MISLSWLVVLISALQFLGWQNIKKEKEPCFVVPSEDVLAVIANQPDCPIEFVTAYSVGFLDSGARDVYQLRNRATKPIRAYTIAIVNSEGTDSKSSVMINDPDHYFLPGEIRPSLQDLDLKIIALTDQLSEKYHLNGKMKAIRVFIVVRVEMTDGSTYDAASKYLGLKGFFKDNPISLEENDTHKK
jgi:hypothetical protein